MLRTLALHLRLVKDLPISYKSSVGRGKRGELTMLYLFHGEIANPVWLMRWCEHLGWQVL